MIFLFQAFFIYQLFVNKNSVLKTKLRCLIKIPKQNKSNWSNCKNDGLKRILCQILKIKHSRVQEHFSEKKNAFFFLHSIEIWDAGRIRTHCKQSKADRRSDCSTWLFLLVSVNGQWLVSCRQTKCSHDIVKYNERETGNKDHVWAESQRLLCHYWKGLGQQTLTNKRFVWKSPSPVLIFLCLFSFKALSQLRSISFT